MNKQAEEILKKAAFYIGVLKSAINFRADEAEKNMWRGTIRGLLEAATILTGSIYDWDGNGIYENHGNEPIVNA